MVQSVNGASTVFRVRQRVGKYRIERRLGEGGFAIVYQAMDTIEGLRVALKVPHPKLISDDVLKDFRHEVRLTAKLDHPNILPLKDANFIDDQFVIVFYLGEKPLSERMRHRMSLNTALDYSEQILEAVAYAHRMKVIHCDVNPDNVLVFPGNRLRLADFGIAKVAQKTIQGSGTGTVGYMAPEQALGRPSAKSDVFSVGLIVYRMLTGKRPEWPYDWPPPGYHLLRRKVHPELIACLQRAIDLNPRKRFRDADQFLRVFRKAKRRALRYAAERREKRR
ncbi:MAG: serine/threonine protein kinase [Planctomycetes bacterium]|nr:serine/threonine protein kinase [Planctomycetota bacterium]